MHYIINRWIIFFLLQLIFFASCGNEYSNFNKLSEGFAKSNKNINESEYKELYNLIKVSNDKAFDKLKTNGEPDNTKIVAHIIKYLKTKKITLTSEAIWQPTSTKNTPKKYIANVYIENSASMDGYVNGITEFETAIYNLLGDLKTNDDCAAMNLNYINSAISYSKKDVLQDDIKDFIEKLEPTTFRLKGGDRGVSDIGDILDTLIKVVDTNNIVMLVSDCVFSAGKDKNGENYLNNQSVSVKVDFAEKLKKFDLSVMLLKLISSYNGNYYDKYDNPIPLNTNRPYYIWIMGSHEHIINLIKSGVLEKIKGGFLNKQLFATYKDNKAPEFKILMNKKVGTFRLPKGAQGPISNAKTAKENANRKFSFTIAVDFSKYLRDTSYFLNPNVYATNANYTISVKPINDKTDLSIKDYTHLLTLTTTLLRSEEVKIEVLDVLPSWVEQSTSKDDTNILNDPSEWNKTFGLKYIVEGMSDAYLQENKTKILETISIDIKN